MRKFEGFGVSHPDILHPEQKKSAHSFIMKRDPESGHVCLRWKEYMRDAEIFPAKDEQGPAQGFRMFVDDFEPHQPPTFEAQAMTAMTSLPLAMLHVDVS